MLALQLLVIGSRHRWLGDERWRDLIVILDDATSEIYYAQLVASESTATVMTALREVVESQECFAPCIAIAAASGISAPSRDGCRKSFACGRSPRWKRRIVICETSTSPAASDQCRTRYSPATVATRRLNLSLAARHSSLLTIPFATCGFAIV